MANTTISKHARQAARAAAAAEAAKLAERNRLNVEDLATFFNARERADGVDEWLAERLEALQQQAMERRSGFVRDGGLALRSMRDRGESVHGIATMTGMTDKAVRDAIRDAEVIAAAPQRESSPEPADVAAATDTEAPATAVGPVGPAPTSVPERASDTAELAAS